MEDKTTPEYYGGADNPYEVIKVINAWGLNFELANVCKYIARSGKKDKSKHIEDLEKAKKYLELEIEKQRSKSSGGLEEHILQWNRNVFFDEIGQFDFSKVGKDNITENKEAIALLHETSVEWKRAQEKETKPDPSTIVATSHFKYGQEVWFLENSSIGNGEVRGFKIEQHGPKTSWKQGSSEVSIYETAGDIAREIWVKEKDCFESREMLINSLNEKTNRTNS